MCTMLSTVGVVTVMGTYGFEYDCDIAIDGGVGYGLVVGFLIGAGGNCVRPDAYPSVVRNVSMLVCYGSCCLMYASTYVYMLSSPRFLVFSDGCRTLPWTGNSQGKSGVPWCVSDSHSIVDGVLGVSWR